jgi:hypothetical protein
VEQKKVEEAMKVLKQAMVDDPDYAHSWHCNLAMAFYDAIDDNCLDENIKYKWRNEGAKRFMWSAFGVNSSA